MSFASLANNQCVSWNNLQDGVDNYLFFPIQPLPVPSTEQITKQNFEDYIVVCNPSYPPFTTKAPNQLVVKSDIYTLGNLVLEAGFGLYFTSINNTTFNYYFSYPSFGTVTTQYQCVVPADTGGVGLGFEVYVDGTVSSPSGYASIEILADNNRISIGALFNTSGSQYTLVSIPSDIYAASEVKIRIVNGTAPPINLADIPMIAIAVSKTTGQYQIAASGAYGASSVRVVTTAEGFLYVSSNYGLSGSWTQIKVDAFETRYWSEVAVSGDGQYMLAVAQNDGNQYTNAWKSNDYGVTWTSIPTDPNFRLYGCAISDDGTYQTITGIDNRITYPQPDPYIIRSTNSGATFVYVTGSAIGGLGSKAFFSVAMDSTGQYQVIAASTQFVNNDPFGYLYYPGVMYRSSNYGQNWSVVGYSAITWPFGLAYQSITDKSFFYVKCSPDSDIMTAALYLEDYTGSSTGCYVMYSTNQGTNWTVISNTRDSGIFRVANTDVVIPLANTQNYMIYNNNYLKIISNYTTVTNWTASGQKGWRGLDMSNNRQIVTGASNTGLFRSDNGGSTWTQIT